MQLFEEINNLPDNIKNCALAIGNFDGVHRGHQILLEKTKNIAKEHNIPFGVLTFEPHPRRLFRPDEPPGRLTPIALKQSRLNSCGVDALFSLPFDWDFASQSAEAFIETILNAGIAPQHIVVGYDFCFGQLRKGSPQTFIDAGYDVTTIEPQKDNQDDILSSSRIRQALRGGDIKAANQVLGWDWYIEGIVVKGDQRGRALGYPTANVHLSDTIHPAYGVYASLVQIEGEDNFYPAATNIGIRPMFEISEGQVEAHILDFDRDIYGKTIRIQPVQRLRSEAKFESIETLIEQMDKDCQKTREILKN